MRAISLERLGAQSTPRPGACRKSPSGHYVPLGDGRCRKLTRTSGSEPGLTSPFDDSAETAINPRQRMAGKFLIDLTDDRFHVAGNEDVLAFVRRTNPFAHSDVGSLLLELGKGARLERWCARAFAEAITTT